MTEEKEINVFETGKFLVVSESRSLGFSYKDSQEFEAVFSKLKKEKFFKFVLGK